MGGKIWAGACASQKSGCEASVGGRCALCHPDTGPSPGPGPRGRVLTGAASVLLLTPSPVAHSLPPSSELIRVSGPARHLHLPGKPLLPSLPLLFPHVPLKSSSPSGHALRRERHSAQHRHLSLHHVRLLRHGSVLQTLFWFSHVSVDTAL